MKKIIIPLLVLLGIAVGLFVLNAKRSRKVEKVHSNEINVQPVHGGDIIFQTSTSGQSKAIQLATKSVWSHMGIIYESEGQYYVYEAVQPVKLTRLEKWIARGVGSHFVVKRLKGGLLSGADLKKLEKAGEKFKGRNYDVYFEWSDDRIYCSELVWKIYKEALNTEIGALQELREFDLTSALVRSKMKERYGDNIPLNEKVISPAAMFDSDKLKTILEK